MYKLRSSSKVNRSDAFDEESFSEVLRLEHKRSDRSGRPFLLLLLNLGSRSDRPSRGASSPVDPVVRRVIRSLEVSTRQTDRIGWYKNDYVLGVIFTEIGGDSVVRLIHEKVMQALQSQLKTEQIGRITLSMHTYPDRNQGAPDSELDTELYPEVGMPNSALFLKRITDVLGSLSLLVLLSPLLLSIAVAVALTSKGPILFRQTRLGRFGKPFTLVKFRSMYANSSRESHELYVRKFIRSGDGETVSASLLQDGQYKIRRDPRITPLGCVLRRTSMDELPQLFNVLGGTMSLVGPRPPTLYEFDCYDNWHKRRVREAKPGITGLWQVTGRSRTTFDEMVRLDLQYLNEWSLLTDIRILALTPWAVLTCRGAY